MAKKLLSLVLVVCMAMSLSIVPVNAGAPVVLDGATKVMFEQSFGGLSGASDLTDFNVSGTGWNYMAGFMIANGGERSIITKENYDVSDAAQWTFTSKQSCTYNGYYIKLAYDEANSKGYVLAYSNETNTLALFRDTGYGYEASDLANAVKNVAINAYNTDVTITVTYTKATNTLKVSNSKNSNVIEYTPTDGYEPSLNGKFGVIGANAGVFTAFNMSLVKSYDSVTVDQWKYDKTFTAANTQAELEADGFTFSKATTPNASGLYTNGKTITFGPNGKDISGDYYFETKISRSMNYYTLDFNQSDAGCYKIEYGRRHDKDEHDKPWVRLYKYDASTGLNHILVNFNQETIPSGLTRTYKGTVKTLDDGSVDINIGIYNGSTLEYTLAYTDTKDDIVSVTTTTTVVDEEGNTVYEEDGVTPKTETTTEDVDTGEPLASGKLRMIDGTTKGYIKYLKAYSIMSEDEQGEKVKCTETIIDRTFVAGDTKQSVATEGFAFKRLDGDNIATDNNGFVLKLNNDYMDYSYEKRGEEYSFTTYTYRTTNYSTIYFNYIDDNNYYKLYVGASGSSTMYYKMYKKVNGGDEVEIASGKPTWNNHGRNAWSTITVTLSKNTDGSMKITAYHKQDNKTAMTISYNDAAPLATGKIRVDKANSGYIKRFAISHTFYESSTNGEEPVFIGRFSNDNGAIKEISKGNIYFEYPTALLGKYTVVAALYEDYKMTELKTFKPIDLYAGKIKLFDTTNSTAEDMKVRVYFFDGGETLNLVADEVYELN